MRCRRDGPGLRAALLGAMATETRGGPGPRQACRLRALGPTLVVAALGTGLVAVGCDGGAEPDPAAPGKAAAARSELAALRARFDATSLRNASPETLEDHARGLEAMALRSPRAAEVRAQCVGFLRTLAEADRRTGAAAGISKPDGAGGDPRDLDPIGALVSRADRLGTACRSGLDAVPGATTNPRGGDGSHKPRDR